MLGLVAPGRYLGCRLGAKAARTDPWPWQPDEHGCWRPAIALIATISIQLGKKQLKQPISLLQGVLRSKGVLGCPGAAGGPIPAGGREDTLAPLSPLIAPLFALGKPKDSLSPRGWGLGGAACAAGCCTGYSQGCPGGRRWQKHRCTKPLVLPVLPAGHIPLPASYIRWPDSASPPTFIALVKPNNE